MVEIEAALARLSEEDREFAHRLEAEYERIDTCHGQGLV